MNLARFLFLAFFLLFQHQLCQAQQWDGEWTGFNLQLDPDRRHHNGWTDAHQIARQGASFASGNTILWEDDGENPAQNGDFSDVVLLFLEHASDQFLLLPEGDASKPKRTALHLAVQYRNWALVRIYCYRGIGLDQADAQGNTPLHYAAKHTEADDEAWLRLDVVWLRVYGADPTLKNNVGQTAIDIAKQKGDGWTVEMLQVDICQLLWKSLQSHNMGILIAFVEKQHSCLYSKMENGDYPIHVAARADNLEAFDMLVCASSVSSELRNDKGETPHEVAPATTPENQDYFKDIECQPRQFWDIATAACWQPAKMDTVDCQKMLEEIRRAFPSKEEMMAGTEL